MFLALSGLIVLISLINEKKVLNTTFLLSAPYVFIIIFNNIWMVKYGYSSIQGNTCFVLFLYTLAIFIAGTICRLCKTTPLIKVRGIDNYSVKWINYFLRAVIGIRIIEVIYTVKKLGTNRIYANDFEDLQLSGVVGHLVLLGMAMVPYLFKRWMDLKNKNEFITIIAYIAVLFLSFIKYHVIILLIVLFLEYCFIKPEKTVKALIVFFTAVIFIFIMNYWVSFFLRSYSFTASFAITRLWTYIAGGVISGQKIQSISLNEYGISEWLLSYISGIVNMIIYIVSGRIAIVNQGWGYIDISEVPGLFRTNVYSQISYFMQFDSYMGVIFAAFIIGFFTELCTKSCRILSKNYINMTPLFLEAFIFLGFFSNYFVLSTVWELILWSVLSTGFINLISSLRKKKD